MVTTCWLRLGFSGRCLMYWSQLGQVVWIAEPIVISDYPFLLFLSVPRLVPHRLTCIRHLPNVACNRVVSLFHNYIYILEFWQMWDNVICVIYVMFRKMVLLSEGLPYWCIVVQVFCLLKIVRLGKFEDRLGSATLAFTIFLFKKLGQRNYFCSINLSFSCCNQCSYLRRSFVLIQCVLYELLSNTLYFESPLKISSSFPWLSFHRLGVEQWNTSSKWLSVYVSSSRISKGHLLFWPEILFLSVDFFRAFTLYSSFIYPWLPFLEFYYAALHSV